ncbi:hypothetical protein VPHD81_0130 [Vibrio phage D81]
MANLVKKYISNDGDTCFVRDDNVVHFNNSANVLCSASNYFNGNKNFHINGYEAERKFVNEAARKGVTALNDVTYQTWRDVTPKAKPAKKAKKAMPATAKPKMTKLAEDILRLAKGEKTVAQIAKATGQSLEHTQLVLTQLEMAGLLTN